MIRLFLRTSHRTPEKVRAVIFEKKFFFKGFRKKILIKNFFVLFFTPSYNPYFTF